MTTALPADRWQLIKDLLADALERPADRRRACVAVLAGEDTELLAELETLLLAAELSRSNLEAAPPGLPTEVLDALETPDESPSQPWLGRRLVRFAWCR